MIQAVDYLTFGIREVIVESPYGQLAVLCDIRGIRIKSVNRDGSEFWVSDPIPWAEIHKP